jgi:hypothetical protein
VPSEFGHGGVLRPIPSVMDLPAELELVIDDGEVEMSSGRRENGINGDVKMRGVGAGRGLGEKTGGRGGKMWELERSGGSVVGKENVKHYDADGKLSVMTVRSLNKTADSLCM